MKINIQSADTTLPIDRAYMLSMTIKSFKGRREVDIHLFRSAWNENEENNVDWPSLIGSPVDPSRTDETGSRKIILEAFTEEERDTIVEYLKAQYSTRLSAIHSEPLSLPVPAGLVGLSEIKTSKNVGVIDFDRIPVYNLKIPLKGLYDLSQHPPIVEE